MLHPDTILQKSEAARQLLKGRSSAELSPRLRAVMVLINGERSIAEIQQTFNTWSDVSALCSQLLLNKLALIASQPTPSPAPAPVQEADKAQVIKVYLLGQAKAIFGKAAQPVLEILEKTETEPQALARAVAQCSQIATMMIDERQAQAFVQSARALRLTHATTMH